jgi:hypothetical protein
VHLKQKPRNKTGNWNFLWFSIIQWYVLVMQKVFFLCFFAYIYCINFFFRCTSEALEKTQIAKLLLLQDNAMVGKFRDKRLQDIQLSGNYVL